MSEDERAAAREASNAARRAWTPERRARANRQRQANRYGLTLEQLDALLARPCAICKEPAVDPSGRTKVPFIDHCHASGIVRDVLCRNCNSAIGLLGDDPKTIRRAAAYVERHRRSL